MRTPDDIAGHAAAFERKDVLRLIALAQAEAAREEFESSCAAQCGFCRDGFPIGVAMLRHALFRHEIPGKPKRTLPCSASLLRAAFGERNLESRSAKQGQRA